MQIKTIAPSIATIIGVMTSVAVLCVMLWDHNTVQRNVTVTAATLAGVQAQQIKGLQDQLTDLKTAVTANHAEEEADVKTILLAVKK